MNPFEKENRSLKRTLHVLISKAERNQDILRTFQDIELRLLSCNRLTDLLDMLLINLKEYFRLDAISLILFDPEQTARGLIEDYTPPDNGQHLDFTENYQALKDLYPKGDYPLLLNPNEEVKTFAFPDRQHIMSCALLPLVRQGIIIGSLHLGSSDSQRYNKNVATDYIQHLASVISVCIENCVSQETLRRLSIIDMLTKVNNRRSFDQELLRELSRANRNQYPLSCLFIDLDYFKRINDTYGHQTGDRVLNQAAQAIKKQLRKTDFIARYGGEEFAVLLPACLNNRAVQVAEAIRTRLRSITFRSDEDEAFKVTLSVGVATCEPIGSPEENLVNSAHQLVACADKAVYQAKSLGRDRVIYMPINHIKPQKQPDMDASLLALTPNHSH
ncbi:sensor domain-containing diguanylate cyclase [Motiliproteus sp. MSK22-1]|uniref:sensor domain-containing diguanylate cyclase n=1 Tax=Motiliproteus sp. MSK22-1 TaxID=1897630 RepID=UPI000975A7A1|nr:sensor domain-containing diguanylate cyclase [Motiliproteus sp. MSK22-1]OMH32838.1 histidine kinase [Motiliproteus sp. MSK22-1]